MLCQPQAMPPPGPAAPAADRHEPAEFVIKTIGVVGLGHMVHAFAANLVEDGYQVLVHDRDPKRIEGLLATGAHGAPRLDDLGNCDAVLTSLPDDDVFAAVALAPDGLVSILAANAVHISTSTVSPTVSAWVAEAHSSHGRDYVAAPVLGNPDFARTRKLFVLAAGAPAALAKVHPLLERLGQRLFVIGEDGASANLFKLAANVLTATTLECMGEVLALLRKAGIDSQLGFEVLTNSLFDSVALAKVERHAVPMPAAGLVHDRLVAMAARGWADLDWTALGLLASVDAGLDDHR